MKTLAPITLFILVVSTHVEANPLGQLTGRIARNAAAAQRSIVIPSNRPVQQLEATVGTLRTQVSKAENISRWAPSDLSPGAIKRTLRGFEAAHADAARTARLLHVVPGALGKKAAAAHEELASLLGRVEGLRAIEPVPAPAAAAKKRRQPDESEAKQAAPRQRWNFPTPRNQNQIVPSGTYTHGNERIALRDASERRDRRDASESLLGRARREGFHIAPEIVTVHAAACSEEVSAVSGSRDGGRMPYSAAVHAALRYA